LCNAHGAKRQLIDRLHQQPAHFVGNCLRPCVDDQPAVAAIDPHARITPDAESARQQFVGDLLLEFAHLFAAWFEALLLFQFSGARLRNLRDDRSRQQFLLGAKHQQHLTV
jgi:hypothetical protein